MARREILAGYEAQQGASPQRAVTEEKRRSRPKAPTLFVSSPILSSGVKLTKSPLLVFMSCLLVRHELLQVISGQQQTHVFEFLSGLAICLLELDVDWRRLVMIP